jgi:hypothetical protein
MNFKALISQFLPVFLFKWDAKISMEPDLDEMAELCEQNKEASFLMKSFIDYAKENLEVDLKKPETEEPNAQS